MRGAVRAARGCSGQLWRPRPAPGRTPPPLLLLLLLLAVLLGGAGAQYSSDLCSWKGSRRLVSAAVKQAAGRDWWVLAAQSGSSRTPTASMEVGSTLPEEMGTDLPEDKGQHHLCQGMALPGGFFLQGRNTGGLTHEAHRKDVEQVYLRCSAGSVEWMYPTGALIVNLRPNTYSPRRPLTVCIKPLSDSAGANIYLEKTGELTLLVRDGDRGPGQVRCFAWDQGGLFVEATPQQDISRRTTGFQYELVSRRPGPHLHAPSAPCRPCSEAEVLLAVCTSDFVVRGSIQDVADEPALQEAAIHLVVSRVFRQKSRVFRAASGGSGRWRGHVKTLLECGVRPGQGDFLFTGHMRFGEAWLGCAPRFKDFQRTYRDAEEKGLNPCAVATE